MKKSEIKAIVFDIGGVLALGRYAKVPVRGHKEIGVHKFIANKLKMSLDQYFDSIDTLYAESMTGKRSEKQLLKFISKNLKTTPNKLKKLYEIDYNKRFKQNKELYSVAFKLKKQGYKIAILSDQWQLSHRVLAPKKYMKKFNKVIISCQVGLRKPDPEIYKLLLKKLKLKPKQIVFIDNQDWNLVPAKKLGMKTILFKNNKQTFREFEKLGIKLK